MSFRRPPPLSGASSDGPAANRSAARHTQKPISAELTADQVASSSGRWVVDIDRMWATRTSPHEKVVLAYLCWAARQGGLAWPSHSTVALMTGLSRRHVIRMLADLSAAGLVETWAAKGRANRYVIGKELRHAPVHETPPAGFSPVRRPAGQVTSGHRPEDDDLCPAFTPPVLGGHRSEDPYLCSAVTPPVLGGHTTSDGQSPIKNKERRKERVPSAGDLHPAKRTPAEVIEIIAALKAKAEAEAATEAARRAVALVPLANRAGALEDGQAATEPP